MRKRIAIVHDWLESFAGAEQVLKELLGLFPEADLYSVVDFLSDADRARLGGRRPMTTFIQRMPGARKHFRAYLSLMPLAIEQLDLSSYEVVISSSHAVAKGVITGPDQIHISYVHSPIRYAWDLQHQYLEEARLTKGVKSWAARWMLHKLRLWDYRTAAGVDKFIANSQFIAGRIRKVYGREAQVVYPPVDVEKFNLQDKPRGDFYLTASRLVPYKKVAVIASAFSLMPDKKLVIIGDGSEMQSVRQAAGPNVQVMGYQPFDVLRDHMQRARGFIFAAEEDFGITPVEAQACGTPVIAYGKGGSLETVRGLGCERPTGVFFHEQTPEAVQDAVALYERNRAVFDPEVCRDHALSFSPERFRKEIFATVAALSDAPANRLVA